MVSGHGASLHFGNLLFLEATDRIAVRSIVAVGRKDITAAIEVQIVSVIVSVIAITRTRRAGPIIAARTDNVE